MLFVTCSFWWQLCPVHACMLRAVSCISLSSLSFALCIHLSPAAPLTSAPARSTLQAWIATPKVIDSRPCSHFSLSKWTPPTPLLPWVRIQLKAHLFLLKLHLQTITWSLLQEPLLHLSPCLKMSCLRMPSQLRPLLGKTRPSYVCLLAAAFPPIMPLFRGAICHQQH